MGINAVGYKRHTLQATRMVDSILKGAAPGREATAEQRNTAIRRVERLLAFKIMTPKEMKSSFPPLRFEETKVGFILIVLVGLEAMIWVLTAMIDRDWILATALSVLFLAAAAIKIVSDFRET